VTYRTPLPRRIYREIAKATGVREVTVRCWDTVTPLYLEAVWKLGVRDYGLEAMENMHVRLQAEHLPARF
jgi:hypothetical protein